MSSDGLAHRPTNSEVAERLAQRDRTGGPTVSETVAQIRARRDAS